MAARKQKVLHVGAHMSIAGGVHLAIERGREVGCDTIQIFTKSSNQWKARPLRNDEIDSFKRLAADTGIWPIVAHDGYLINVAASDGALHEKSRASLMEELERCEILGIPYLVMHPGAHVGAGEEHGIARISEALNAVFSAREGRTMICLETTAGQGTTIGHRFEQVARIIDGIENKDRIGVCIDTCHLFAAGYELSPAEKWKETFRRFDATIGLDRIKCFHVNDSKKEAGSRIDRHEHIGRGKMGLEPFRLLMNDPRFRALPKLLETPKGEAMEEDRMNLKILRSLVREP